MKKERSQIFFKGKDFRKTVIIMKLNLLLIFVCTLNVFGEAYSQQSNLDIALNEVETRQVLEVIENQSDFKFFYLSEQIDMDRKVTINVKEASIEEVLDKLFEASPVEYKILEDNLIVLILTEAVSLQPDGVVSGIISSAGDGKPLPGVNIVEKGTTNGTISDSNGAYSLTLQNPESAFLVISFVGYLTVEADVSGQGSYNCFLFEDIARLNEVIVIGYGTSTKKDITGALATVGPEEITAVPVTKIEEALKGRISGVNVLQGNFQPGTAPMIVIRGRNSMGLTGNSSGPLWIVDGFPFAGSINPNDVASITVLKDASATAIYGSRGSNGVILVTTKKGTRNKQSIEFSANYGLTQVRDKIDLLNAEQYINAGRLEADILDYDGPDTDWQDLTQRKGSQQEYNLSYSGGNEKSRTFFSMNYKDVQGVVKSTYYKSLQARINTERTISENFKLYNIMSATLSNDNRINISREALLFPPDLEPIDIDGNYTYFSSVGLTNPFGTVEERINSYTGNKIYDYLSGELTFLNDFVAKVSFGGTIDNQHNVNFWPKTITNINLAEGEAGQRYSWAQAWTNENQLLYSKLFAEKHFVKATAFFSQEFLKYGGFSASNRDLPTDELLFNALQLNIDNATVSSDLAVSTLMSLGARFDYNFSSKYYFTATVRRDGSSKFADNKKWATFPAFAASWRINEESFMENLEWISNAKLRLSYGKTGNQGIPDKRSREQYGPSYYYMVLNDIPQLGLVQTVVENPDLTWETTSQYNAGLDLSILNDRVSLTMDYYNKITTDLLFRKQVSGTSYQYINQGEVKNEGLEISLSTAVVRSSSLNWNIDLNYSFNRNKILDLGEAQEIFLGGFGGYIMDPINFLREGYPMGVFYGFQTIGVFADDEDVASHPEQTAIKAEPGEYKIMDINNDGVCDENDMTIIGNPEPDFLFGINNYLSYKSFSLGIFVQGSIGNEIYNSNNASFLAGHKTFNRSIAYLDVWTEENRITEIPKKGAVSTRSVSAYVEDGSYIRLRDISLGYKLPQKIASAMNVENLTVSVSAQNWFTLTNYTGYDPEVSYYNDNSRQGIDYTAYPSTKSITFGLKLTL